MVKRQIYVIDSFIVYIKTDEKRKDIAEDCMLLSCHVRVSE